MSGASRTTIQVRGGKGRRAGRAEMASAQVGPAPNGPAPALWAGATPAALPSGHASRLDRLATVSGAINRDGWLRCCF